MFIVTLTYTAPLTEIDARLTEHNDWLDRHYSAGLFVGSGRRVPREGGVIVVRDADRDVLDAALAGEPFLRDGVATAQVVEFSPSRGPLADLA
ncbi:YciI family protein [Longispora sp. K20-0274]|uniref:YciI family protein n=1 Tax=Longispora sp. K20-0274 TaxID=3088255 RepID=UPI00399C4919